MILARVFREIIGLSQEVEMRRLLVSPFSRTATTSWFMGTNKRSF